MRYSASLLFILLLAGWACSNSTDADGNPPSPPEPDSYQVEAAFPELSFDRPLDLQHPGDGSNRLFVVEQAGIIKVFENDPSTTKSPVFLDLKNRVSSGGERGLLGLAFHPNFEANGLFYVNYTTGNPLRTVISQFQVSQDNPNRADKNSETVLLTFEQPFGNHNGGQIRFGPDGYLYIATGDGGSGGDPRGNAQDRSTLLGNILRIDVDTSTNGSRAYAIPPENPYVDNNRGFREEIFAYGLRNPFRFSFDATSGTLWAGDVGQNKFEEIDIIRKGENYGWNILEGNSCYQSDNCDRSGLTDPIYVYDHSQGQSVTGGFVYRGPTLKGLEGRYIYADFISGRIWSLNAATPQKPDNRLLTDTDLPISSFGVDANNELYICAFDGKIYQLRKSSE